MIKSPIRLLYVEDDTSLSKVVLPSIEEILTQQEFHGITVRHAASYWEAVRLLEETDIVLSDCYCPGKEGRQDDKFGLGGFDLLRDVQTIKAHTGRVMPFVFASSTALTTILEQMDQSDLCPLPAGRIVEKLGHHDEIERVIKLLVDEFRNQPKPVNEIARIPVFAQCVV